VQLLRLQTEAFGDDPAACLGGQLAAVIEAIARVRPPLQWYVADVETTGFQFPFGRHPEPRMVGDAASLMTMARQVEQFVSGVFVGVPADQSQPTFRGGGLWTDDDELADLGDALVEVRTFDTSCVLVASRDADLLDAVERHLKTQRGRAGANPAGAEYCRLPVPEGK
jgi:hypothetical protein